MSGNVYIIDTSSLIDLQLWYSRDIFLGIWRNMERLIEKNLLISSNLVLDELKAKDDELSRWARRTKMFRDSTVERSNIAIDIETRYRGLMSRRLSRERTPGADSSIIALAITERDNGSNYEIKVVTQEILRGNQTSIPSVCEHYNIKAIKIIDIFREEGWKF